jgi:hypothetical protein
VDGDWNDKDFGSRVNLYKLTERVKQDLIDYVNIKRPKLAFQSLKQLVQVFPVCGDPSWFNSLLKCASAKKKDKIGAHAMSMIDAMIHEQEEKVRQSESVQVLESDVFYGGTILGF